MKQAIRHDDSIPRKVIAGNSAWVFGLGLATAAISGGIGALISVVSTPDPGVSAVAGWAATGIVLFGFPIIMALMQLKPKVPAETLTPSPRDRVA